MTGLTRVRISLSAGDFEVEGSEEFVAQYGDAIQTLIDRLEKQPIQALGPAPEGAVGSTAAGVSAPPVEHGEFGEVLHALPAKASGSDRILLAGLHVQRGSEDTTFSTGEANELLLGQGVKLSNPSQALKNAIKAKRVFRVGSRYRVSKTGEEHLKSLVGQ